MCNYTISPATVDEIPTLLGRLNASEGWNLCPDAPAVWLSHDPGCYLVGRVNGTPIATINAFRYDDSYGFITCYWVAPEHRGKGYGLRLFQEAVSHLSGCNIGLFAVPDEVSAYEKSGFIAQADSAANYRGRAIHRPVSSRIVPYDAALFDAIAAYDRTVFPCARSSFLRQWLAVPNFVVRVCVEGGAVRGFALLCSGVDYPEIHPVFADNLEIALELVASLANEVPAGGDIGIVVQTGNPQAGAFFEGLAEYAFVPVISCRVMHTNGQPDVDAAKVWAPTSLDLG
jgi:GNAT superfamily N-acetyltransferase